MMPANEDDLSGEALPADAAPDKRRQCHHCGGMADRLAIRCPECQTELPAFGHTHRSARGRRYVYGKRKTQLSQEAVWLIVVIIVGLLIVFGVQVVAFMRTKKLMLVPVAPRPMIARLLTDRTAGWPRALVPTPRRTSATLSLAIAFVPKTRTCPRSLAIVESRLKSSVAGRTLTVGEEPRGGRHACPDRLVPTG